MDIDALLGMLKRGNDSAMLRFTLGRALLDQKQPDQAEVHLRRAIELDPRYSAAWQWLTQCLLQLSQPEAALEVARQGIEAAHAGGDQQVEKILRVLEKRALKALAAQPPQS